MGSTVNADEGGHGRELPMDYKASSFPGTCSRMQGLVWAIGFLVLPCLALAKVRFRDSVCMRGLRVSPHTVQTSHGEVNAHLEEAAYG